MKVCVPGEMGLWASAETQKYRINIYHLTVQLDQQRNVVVFILCRLSTALVQPCVTV